MSKWILLLGVVGGCWRGDGRETTPASSEPVAATAPQDTGAPCDRVAAHVRDIMAASDEGPTARRADDFRVVIARRCSADGWSIELKQCLLGSPTLDATNECEKLATEEQSSALEQDVVQMTDAK